MMSVPQDSSSATAEAQLAAECTWSDQPVQLKELPDAHPLPAIVRVTKGQYRNIGVSKTVHSDLYVHSIKTIRKVLAEGVKVKEGKHTRLLATDQRFSLPISYRGWFELLSEDGKAVKALTSVMELVRLQPNSCLVRETMKAYISRDDTKEGSVLDKTRVVQAGETITLAGEVFAPVSTTKGVVKMRTLRCHDNNGESLYMPFDQAGMFSPVAGLTNISGVHTIKAILDKFRLPVLVRLVHGIIPTKVERTFTGVFRLTSVYNDDTAFVIPLKKDSKMVPISTREPLKMVLASNMDSLKSREDTRYYQYRCSQMIVSYMNSIHVLISTPDPALLVRSQEDLENDHQAARRNSTTAPPSDAIDPEEEEVLMDEIEDIYRYVREGGVVPAPRPRPKNRPKCTPPPDPVAKAMANPHLQHGGGKKPLAAVNPRQPSGSPTVAEGDVKPNETPRGGAGRSGEFYTWEEPIYEHLDKIRQSKNVQQVLRQTIVLAKPQGKPSPDKKPAIRPPPAAHGHDAAPPLPVRCPLSPTRITSDSPVANLRQVMKQNHDHFSAHHYDMATSPDYDNPPVPPKTFFDEEPIVAAAPTSSSRARVRESHLTSPDSADDMPPRQMNVSVYDNHVLPAGVPTSTRFIVPESEPRTKTKRPAPPVPSSPSIPSSVQASTNQVHQPVRAYSAYQRAHSSGSNEISHGAHVTMTDVGQTMTSTHVAASQETVHFQNHRDIARGRLQSMQL